MTAIGRASVPAPARLQRRKATAPANRGKTIAWQRPARCDPWMARGLLWRLSCGRALTPVLRL
ncbi:MAG: hypothetical protein ACRDT8_22545, partial [Micromonosporaceae bacterium]